MPFDAAVPQRPGVHVGDGPGAARRARLMASPRYPQLVLVTVLSGLFSIGFTITILAVSIPTIAEDLATTKASLTWIITGPLLAFGVLGPAMGKAGDLYGHKRLYVGGVAVAAVFSGLTAWSPTAGHLVAFRILGAAAGAAAGPVSAAMINRLYPRSDRVRAMGWFSFVAAGAPVLGVIAGGPVVENFSWRLIFAVQCPLLVLVVVAAIVVLPDLERAPRVSFDVAGAVLLAIGATSLLFGLNRAAEWGWGSTGVLVAFVTAPVALAGFVAVESRTAHPLIPLEFFRRRNFSVPAVAGFFMNFAYMGGFIITPLFLEEVYGYGETRVGLLSIARPIPFALSGPIAGYLATRVGERRTGVFGTASIAASMVALAMLGSGAPDLQIMGALALSGIGLGTANPGMQASVANAVPEEHLGIAGATMQLMSQVGIVTGIQVMQTTQLGRADTVGLAQSYADAYWVGCGAAVLAVVAAWFVRSTERRGHAPDGAEPARRLEEIPEPAPR